MFCRTIWEGEVGDSDDFAAGLGAGQVIGFWILVALCQYKLKRNVKDLEQEEGEEESVDTKGIFFDVDE